MAAVNTTDAVSSLGCRALSSIKDGVLLLSSGLVLRGRVGIKNVGSCPPELCYVVVVVVVSTCYCRCPLLRELFLSLSLLVAGLFFPLVLVVVHHDHDFPRLAIMTGPIKVCHTPRQMRYE